MDIQTKLVFALVAVALASMAALGTVMSVTAERDLRTNRLTQIEGLAESRKDAVQQIVEGWRDRVSLIASRTQLRQSLPEWSGSPSGPVAERVGRILDDARRAVVTVDAVTVFDSNGTVVSAVGSPFTRPILDTPLDQLLSGGSPILIGLATPPPGDDGSPSRAGVEFETGLHVDGEPVGALRTRLSAEALMALSEDRTGLGLTGRTLIVVPGEDGAPRVLERTTRDTPLEPFLSRVLTDTASVHWQGLTDASGNALWAATRPVPGIGWAVVVTIDEEEAEATALGFRGQTIRMGLALGAFAILAGILLGVHFGRPILDLAGVAERVGDGELSARATVHAEDEVGFLARAFNSMADDLEDRMTLLREFERFFNVSVDMMCIAGTDGYFKRVNPAFQRTLGWTPEELVAKPFMEFVHPDDVGNTVAEVEKLSKGIPTIAFENRYRTRAGVYRVLAWATYPDPDTGLLYAIARDVTDAKHERQEREELSRRLQVAEAKLRAAP